MKVPSREELAQSGTLEELYGKLSWSALRRAGNKKVASLWPAARKNFEPAHWRYEQARGALDAAGRLINTELAERRNLILFNPASGESYGTVRTLVTAYQMIMPGEWRARTPTRPTRCVSFSTPSRAPTTEVDGVQDRHGTGDVSADAELVEPRPRQTTAAACAYWLDFLDVPLVQLLEPMFFEPAEEETTDGLPTTRRRPKIHPSSSH